MAHMTVAPAPCGDRRHLVTYRPETPEVDQTSNTYGPKSAPHIWLSSMLG